VKGAAPTSSRRGGGGEAGLPVLDSRRRGTKFVELPVRSIVNSPESTGMGFWSVNPYVGCEFGCTYCYARFAHRYVVERARHAERIGAGEASDLGNPHGLEPFEHRVFVKRRRNVLAALDRDCARIRRRTSRDGLQNVLIGTGTDPYQPAERQYQITRAILRRLAHERGFRLGIITKSPLVLRDLAILEELVQRHAVSVYVSITSVDTRVIKLFEARSPMPHTRLRAVARLTAVAIRTGLIVAPILPGITDSSKQIRALMHAAKAADAAFVRPVPLRLYPDIRRRFLPIVERHFPRLAPRYRAAYADDWNVPAAYDRAVRKRFHRIAVEYGIEDVGWESEDEARAAAAPAAAAQLGLWER
jgi:DNA repair photolyase